MLLIVDKSEVFECFKNFPRIFSLLLNIVNDVVVVAVAPVLPSGSPRRNAPTLACSWLVVDGFVDVVGKGERASPFVVADKDQS